MNTVISECIYELTRVELIEKLNNNTIECVQWHSGMFDSNIIAAEFIRKHEHTKNVFFIVRTWVLNPTHYGQTHDNIFEYTLDYNGDVIDKNMTHHFVVNHNELNSQLAAKFIGRDNPRFKKNDIAWFYDTYKRQLCRCKIYSLPIDSNEAKRFDNLDWYDDSYIVHPYPLSKNDNHQHILSCMLFKDNIIKEIINNVKNEKDK